MAPLPDNSTSRLFIDYVTNSVAHSFCIRFGGTGGIDGAQSLAKTFLDTLASVRPPGWAITGARLQSANSNVSFPTTAPTIVAGTASTLGASDNPRFVTWVGRGQTSGRRVRLFLYGLSFALPSDYRISGSDNATILNARNVLENAASGLAITVAGDDATWYSYANVGFNSYWEREARTS